MTLSPKKTFVFLCLYTLCITSFAQKVISGRVTDESNSVCQHADILVSIGVDATNIIEFTTTDSKGEFNLELDKELDTIYITASSLGLNDETKLINLSESNLSYVQFKLNKRIQDLEEVDIIAKPKIQYSKDTTIFNLQNIKNGTERTVEDYIKKLPGVEITSSGKFKFKGKEVTKVLLDGDDLFDSSYTIGTQNINANAIEGIQAIENYQENPLLQGMSRSNKVAINLKFKKNLTYANNAEVGYGYKDKYYLDQTSIALTPNFKAYGQFNHHNLGKHLNSSSFNPKQHIWSLGSTATLEGIKSPMFIEMSSFEALTQGEQANDNNAYFGSLNLLPKLNKTTQLRANLNFFSDRSLQINDSHRLITLSDSTYSINESTDRKFKPVFFNGDLSLKKFSKR